LSSTLTVKSKTPVMVIAQRINADPPTSNAPPRTAAAMIAPVPQTTMRSGIRVAWAATGPAGMSVVIAARSAWVREPSAWPTRASSSSSLSRPATYAALSASIAASRSACAALSWPRRAAAALLWSSGPVVTGASRGTYPIKA